MKKFYIFFASMLAMSSLTLTSCHSGDEDEPYVVVDNGDLISSEVPYEEGWSGDSRNGTLKYTPEDYEEDEPNSYFAFSMKDGRCDEAVYNVVMPNAVTARLWASKLNSGTWVDDDWDDDEYYRPESRGEVSAMTKRILKQIKKTNATRSGFTLPIPVTCNGRVLYISLPNVKGLTASELEKVMDYWVGNGYVVPDHVLFGKYEDGVYTCSNMHGMNIDYVVRTKFNDSGICTKYTTTMTFPTGDWADFYYEIYESSLDQYEESFGRRPDLSRDGNSVILDAVIIGDVTRRDVDDMIYTLDWMNNSPFLFSIFG
ncbi:MAG: hypothetical protein K2J15_04150 [Muribaculaceae bacterium]|nr:hypothetical protein [Muribaculaceae bacterium]